MVSINYAFKEIISKIVYYGPGLSGKTTNLQHVFKKVPKDTRGELISLATDADRTLYFDFLPVNVGNIRGFQVKFQLYTVPGQVYYNATRKLVLRGVDGLVFVADSQIDKMDENIESLKNLEENLIEYGYNLNEIPFVIQFNKRDLPNIASIEDMQARLNPRNVPYYEAVASTGSGVFATLKAISKLVIDKAQRSSVERSETKTAVVAAMNIPEGPKPQTVAAAVERETPARAQAQPEAVQKPAVKTHDIELEQGEISISEPEPAYGELRDDAINGQAVESQTNKTTPILRRPAIIRDSETMTNVVVSSDVEKAAEHGEHKDKEDIEETTEHAVLKDIPHAEPAPFKRRHHKDVLDADKLDFLKPRIPEPEPEPEPPSQHHFDEDETFIADPKQMGQAFSKPQMAESVKIKGKKKAGLFGWLKKK